MTGDYKEVYFGTYCKTCKHRDLNGYEEPCDECLSVFANLYSHKPVKYEENSKKEITNEQHRRYSEERVL